MCSKFSGECTLQRSACNNQRCLDHHQYWMSLQVAELDRDFYLGSLKNIKHLIHIDKKPNFDLKSARFEIYKISITFPYFSKSFTVSAFEIPFTEAQNEKNVNSDNAHFTVKTVQSNHRVLFQNADGNINMGFLFDDPRNKTLEIYWMQLIGLLMEESLKKNEGLVEVNYLLKTQSCYVELHRNRFHNKSYVQS